MNRVLILTAIIFLSVVMISCGGDDDNSKPVGSLGGDCYPSGICDNGLVCNLSVNICVSDTGDTEDFSNEHDGLNWSDASSETDQMGWDEAITYCEDLGGRLPTISELRTLIQSCSATETGGECKVTDNCLSGVDCFNGSNDACDGCESDENNPGKYSVFGDSAWFWSSSEDSDNKDFAWYVHFVGGVVNQESKGFRGLSVRCVE